MQCPFHRDLEAWLIDVTFFKFRPAHSCPCPGLADRACALIAAIHASSPADAPASIRQVEPVFDAHDRLLTVADQVAAAILPSDLAVRGDALLPPSGSVQYHDVNPIQGAHSGSTQIYDPAMMIAPLSVHAYTPPHPSTSGSAHAHYGAVGQSEGMATAVRCFFGGPSASCSGFIYLGTCKKVADVQLHLKEFHAPFAGSATEANGRVACQWYSNNYTPCTTTLGSPYQLAKHIATVHLKLFKIQCDRCGKDFARKDSLHRHEVEGRCSRG